MKKILLFAIFCFSFCQENIENYLIIGDSISTYKNGWQDVVSKHYKANCTNLSIGGKTTDWMLDVLKKHLTKTETHYSKVYIYGGINDMFQFTKIDSAISNVQKMVDLINSKNAKAIVIVGYDTRHVIANTWIKDKTREKECIDRYIAYQKGLLKIKNATIVPIISMTTADTHDGIHPNASGHKKISNYIIQQGF